MVGNFTYATTRPFVHLVPHVETRDDAVYLSFEADGVLIGRRPACSQDDVAIARAALASPVQVRLRLIEDQHGAVFGVLFARIRLDERVAEYPLGLLRRLRSERSYPDDLGAECRDMLSSMIPVPVEGEMTQAVEALLATL